MKHDKATAGKASRQSARNSNPGGQIAAPPESKSRLRTHALLVAAILALTFCAYSNSFHAPLLMDSDSMILKDGRVHTVSPVQRHRIFHGQYWETIPNGLYRPLTTLSYLLNYAILGNGADPAGYHWLNFLLHAANIALVYALGLALFEQIPAAFFLSALWGLHPVLTESVTYIVGRADMLAAFGVLAALLCHRQALRASGLRKALWLAAIVCAVSAGMFSKENAIAVLGVIALYDLTFGRSTSWRSRIPSYLAAALPCLVFLYVRAQVIAGAPYSPTPFTDNPLLGAGFWTARITAVKVIGRYLCLLLWPAQLSTDYSYNEIPLFTGSLTNWDDAKAVFALIACVAAVALALRSFRRNPVLSFSIGFFFVTLAPTSNVFLLIGTIMGERFLYLPAVGFAAGAIWALNTLSKRLPESRANRRYLAAALGVVLIVYAVRTYDRNGDWLDNHRLWLSAADAAPGSYEPHINLATTAFLLTQKDWDDAVRETGRALAILDPLPDSQNAFNAYLDAGVFYQYLGDRLASAKTAGNPAAEWYRKSLAALQRSERIQLAWSDQARRENARRGTPGLTYLPARLYLELGRAYMRLSDLPHALVAFERGRTLESQPDLLEELAAAYRAEGEARKAAIALEEALAVDSSRSQITPKLVELYGEIDPRGCSVSHEGGVPNLNPDCPLVHGDICTAMCNIMGNYQRRDQQFEASEVRRVATKDLGCAPELLQ